MTKTEMLNDLINYYADGNKSKFARILGVTPQVIIGWSARSSMSKELLYQNLEGLSAHWLLTDGDGDMIAQTMQESPESEKENNKRIANLKAHIEELEARIDNLRAALREKNAAQAIA